jgi:putative NIF3 family GTP cyclohydrolase 1 type 2
MSKLTRRVALRNSTVFLSSIVLANELVKSDEKKTTPSHPATPSIQQVIDLIISKCVSTPFKNTVDVVKTGDPGQPVKGIVTTFLATSQVIQKAVELGANLIITHEPTFYNHLDNIKWLESDPVYQSKKQLLEKNQIVVWRFHDYWHSHKPDGIMVGVLKELGWEKSSEGNQLGVCMVPPQPLSSLTVFFKKKLNISTIQMTGDPQMICRRVAFAVGASGGENQIGQLARSGADVLVVGEINEWETCVYVQDAIAAGHQKALLILGHANSEEAGMKYLVEWLKPMVPGVVITHIPCGEPVVFV